MQRSDEFLALCEAARKHVHELSIEDVKNRLLQDKNFHLIDVRDKEEFTEGHLPLAHHMSRGMIELLIHQLVSGKDQEIILYCGSGNRSVLAAESLQKMGYSNVHSMSGGYKGWAGLGLPTSMK